MSDTNEESLVNCRGAGGTGERWSWSEKQRSSGCAVWGREQRGSSDSVVKLLLDWSAFQSLPVRVCCSLQSLFMQLRKQQLVIVGISMKSSLCQRTGRYRRPGEGFLFTGPVSARLRSSLFIHAAD